MGVSQWNPFMEHYYSFNFKNCEDINSYFDFIITASPLQDNNINLPFAYFKVFLKFFNYIIKVVFITSNRVGSSGLQVFNFAINRSYFQFAQASK